MVVGSGLIANKFKGIENALVFASGISNSSENDPREFEREKELLTSVVQFKTKAPIIYFSSISVLTQVTPYTAHKREMESFVRGFGIDYFIFRLPQLVGNGGSPKNLINFMVEKIKAGEQIQIYNTRRSLLDVDDARQIVEYVIQNFTPNKTLNVGGVQPLSILEIVDILQSLLKVNTTIIKNDDNIPDQYVINSEEVEEAIRVIGISHDLYTKKILAKYVGH